MTSNDYKRLLDLIDQLLDENAELKRKIAAAPSHPSKFRKITDPLGWLLVAVLFAGGVIQLLQNR